MDDNRVFQIWQGLLFPSTFSPRQIPYSCSPFYWTAGDVLQAVVGLVSVVACLLPLVDVQTAVVARVQPFLVKPLLQIDREVTHSNILNIFCNCWYLLGFTVIKVLNTLVVYQGTAEFYHYFYCSFLGVYSVQSASSHLPGGVWCAGEEQWCGPCINTAAGGPAAEGSTHAAPINTLTSWSSNQKCESQR